jgi:hypothetical protein
MKTSESTFPPPPVRPSYHEGMLLDASDFQDEQTYHRGRLAEVLRRLHGFGTVAGLKVEPIKKGDALPDGTKATEDTIKVNPGIAVDRPGRLLEVPNARCLRLDKWFAAVAVAGSAVLKPFTSGAERWLVSDVFLRYLECPKGLRPAFPEAGGDATDAVVAARLEDGFELLLAPRSSETAGQEPPLPKKLFGQAPATRRQLLDSIYASYTQADPVEYPIAPKDDTPAGTPAKKLEERTALFLARVLIRLTDTPATDLVRHASNDFKVEDEARPLLPAAALFLALTPFA